MLARSLITGLVVVLGLASPATAEDDARTKAIDRGVQFLKGLHKKSANYDGGSYKFGSAALCGLALLESGVPPSDPVIQNITDYVRRHALPQDKVYEMSLGIMYLDRLGDRADQPVIQYLAVGLLGSQSVRGMWSYTGADPLAEAEAVRIRKAIYEDNRLQTPNVKDKPADAPIKGKDQPQVIAPPLHPEVVKLARTNGAFVTNLANRGDGCDLSNTQFAVLALWIARKHGVAVNFNLLATEKNYRFIQKRDGGWDYPGSDPDDMTAGNETTAPMTCSGLVALAVARGLGLQALRVKSANPLKTGNGVASTNDRAVAAALKYLETAMKSERIGVTLRDNLYFLWSLERVAVIYDLETIGSVEWYKWGADHLLKSQSEDGSWGSNYTGSNGEINTAFALLFLNRANLAKDLTATLKGTAKINLPERKTDPEPIKVNPKQSGDPEAEATRLANELIKATATTRPTTLAKLRDTKGSVYTEALVRAIAKLQGEPQREAREALALRLKRMTALTLREMLKDENREIRNAAAWACGLKDDKQFISDLIVVLNDTETLVVQSARNSLRSLSGKDFGPQSDANPADKAKSIADWKAWLAAQPK